MCERTFPVITRLHKVYRLHGSVSIDNTKKYKRNTVIFTKIRLPSPFALGLVLLSAALEASVSLYLQGTIIMNPDYVRKSEQIKLRC